MLCRLLLLAQVVVTVLQCPGVAVMLASAQLHPGPTQISSWSEPVGVGMAFTETQSDLKQKKTVTAPVHLTGLKNESELVLHRSPLCPYWEMAKL